MRKIICLITLSLLSISMYCQTNDAPPVEIEWQMGENGIQPSVYDNKIILTNISGKQLDANWVIYFNQTTRKIIQDENVEVKVEEVKPNFFKLTPTAYYKPLAPNAKLIVPVMYRSALVKESQAPESFYFIKLVNGKETQPIALNVFVKPFDNKKQWTRTDKNELPYPNGNVVYNDNQRFKDNIVLKQTDIFPSVKSALELSGKTVLTNNISVVYPKEFASEANYLINKLDALYNIKTINKKTPNIVFKALDKSITPKNDEYYELEVNNNCIKIAAATAHGAFNAVQTLLGLVKNQKTPIKLDNVQIKDYPDLLYRGIMLDVARNYTTKENFLKLLDRLAEYKINVLHFHLSDDEGWRIEIPGLEELTSVGGKRAHTLDERNSLYPNYSGGASPSDIGSGYYTTDDFIEILKYAKDRHIDIIPEIDLPAHARAAIVSMNARYKNYIDTDKDKAEEYLLADFNDKSSYVSAQGYYDNVINIAMPSTYKFVEKVFDEIQAMYEKAGVPLISFHMGGDEVPLGSWEKSEIAQQFMKEHGIDSYAALRNYFIDRVANYIQSKGVNVAAWQEAALNRNQSINGEHIGNLNSLYAWNTMPEWKGDRIPYGLANEGYDVILCNLTNFYFDLSYNKHQSEPGHTWAGFNNEYDSFDMLPYHVYQSTRYNMAGKPFDLNTMPEGKPVLTEESKKHIKGVQGQLFAETIRDYDMVEYYFFPKMLGLVERGWNASPEWSNTSDWSNTAAYDQALALYNAKIAKGELPRLAYEGANFRLSQPGIIVRDGMLLANSAVPNVEIRYTLDGSEPTSESILWEAPIAVSNAKLIKAKSFYLGKESVTTRLEVE